jgi:glycosyltransferase involved in cell wall biosynthesis
MAKTINLLVIQSSLPVYRIPFFNALAQKKSIALKVYYSESSPHRKTNLCTWAFNFSLKKNALLPFSSSFSLAFLPLKEVDILIIPPEPLSLSFLILYLRARLTRKITIYFWTQYWGAYSTRLKNTFKDIILLFADGCIFYADREVQLYNQGGLVPKKKKVIGLNNGVDTRHIQSLSTSYNPALRNRSIVFIGRLTKKSNFDYLLHALANPMLNDFTLHVIGSGTTISSHKAYASQLGIQNRVKWHGTLHEETLIAEIVNNSSLFVYPGAVGLSLIHAMAYGLPVIVHSNVLGHMPEINATVEPLNCIYFKERDSDSLAHAILTLYKNESLRVTMSNNNKVTTLHSYNTDDMSARLFEFLVSGY